MSVVRCRCERMTDTDFTDCELVGDEWICPGCMSDDELAATAPECPYCGVQSGLRQVHDGGGFIEPEFICEACFTPTDEGPCFDDLKESKP